MTMRLLAVSLLVASNLSCGGASQCPPQHVEPTPVGEAAPEPRPTDAASDYQAQDRVWIRFGQYWYPGRVVSVLRTDVYEVSYEGYGPEWNTVGRPERLRPYNVVPPPAELASSPPTMQPEPGYPVSDASAVHQGMRVLINWHDTWWPGEVIAIERDGATVRYDGYDASSDEKVTFDRLSIPRSSEPMRESAPHESVHKEHAATLDLTAEVRILAIPDQAVEKSAQSLGP